MVTKMVYNRKFLVDMLSTLEKVKAAPYTDAGICRNVTYRIPEDYLQATRLLRRIFRLWPQFSGCTYYPIKGGERAFGKAEDNKTMWVGKYGEARYHLLNFTIQSVQDMIDYIDEQLEADEED